MGKCTCDKQLCSEAICITDFAGNNTHKGEWADWCPNSKRVVFGGHWWNIPDWFIDYCPTETEVNEYLNKFEITEGLQWEDMQNIPAIAKLKRI